MNASAISRDVAHDLETSPRPIEAPSLSTGGARSAGVYHPNEPTRFYPIADAIAFQRQAIERTLKKLNEQIGELDGLEDTASDSLGLDEVLFIVRGNQ